MAPVRKGVDMECWIPDEVDMGGFDSWKEYDEYLYSIFKRDFVESRPLFDGLEVRPRTNPRFDEREESFWHLTCRDYGHKDGLPQSRDPDLSRCRRIKWPRAFIEHYLDCEKHDIDPGECTGVIVWKSTHKPKKGKPKPRVKLFLEEERYLLIMERRNDYYLLITAYEVTEEWSLRSIKREAAKKGA